MKDKKTRMIALYMGRKTIVPEGGISSGHAELGVVEISESGVIRNLDPAAPLRDVTFYCQWNEKCGADPFAYEVYMDTSRVDLQCAENAVKVLRKVRKIEKSFQVRPLTFGQWLVLAARGLGISRLVKLVGGSGMSYSDNEHCTFSLAEAQSVIDQAISECRK